MARSAIPSGSICRRVGEAPSVGHRSRGAAGDAERWWRDGACRLRTPSRRSNLRSRFANRRRVSSTAPPGRFLAAVAGDAGGGGGLAFGCVDVAREALDADGLPVAGGGRSGGAVGREHSGVVAGPTLRLRHENSVRSSPLRELAGVRIEIDLQPGHHHDGGDCVGVRSRPRLSSSPGWLEPSLRFIGKSHLPPSEGGNLPH